MMLELHGNPHTSAMGERYLLGLESVSMRIGSSGFSAPSPLTLSPRGELHVVLLLLERETGSVLSLTMIN